MMGYTQRSNILKIFYKIKYFIKFTIGRMTYTYSYLGSGGQEGCQFRARLGSFVRPCPKIKKKKQST